MLLVIQARVDENPDRNLHFLAAPQKVEFCRPCSLTGGSPLSPRLVYMKSFDKTERPAELLQKLEEHRITYSELVVESGGLAVAAYRVARARCHAGSLTSTVPTLRELVAAATEIINHATLTGFTPDGSMLANECEQLGLVVITPLNRRVA